jgi:hypothetical protein
MRLVARTRKWKQKKQKNRRLAGAKDQIEVQTINRTPNKLRINFPYKILVEAWRNHPTSERCHRRLLFLHGKPSYRIASRGGCTDQLSGFQATCSGICGGSRWRRRRIGLYIYLCPRSQLSDPARPRSVGRWWCGTRARPWPLLRVPMSAIANPSAQADRQISGHRQERSEATSPGVQVIDPRLRRVCRRPVHQPDGSAEGDP